MIGKIFGLLFVLSLLILSFGYGVATVYWKVFPYPVIRDARIALGAWTEVLEFNLDAKVSFPRAFEKFEPDSPPHPTAESFMNDRSVDDGLILISGGPYQLMDHCPRYGCMAWLIDRTGKVIHTWEVNLDKLWEDTSHLSGLVSKLNIYPIGMQLLDKGDLAITFQALGTFPYAAGIIRVDQQGEILWKRLDYSHHWPDSDAQGRIYTPAIRIIESPVTIGDTRIRVECETGKLQEELVRIISPEGRTIREISVMSALAASNYRGLLYAVRNPCDVTHLNSVVLVPAHVADLIEGVEVGDLLVSLRSPNLVAVLDGESGAVKRAVSGRTIAQHSPHFLPDGRVLVFDNLGGSKSQGGSRVVRLDLITGELKQVFPRPDSADSLPFYSETAGHIDISKDGTRALVSVTHQGRVLEIDVASGKVLWEYNNVHDIAVFLRDRDIVTETTIARFAAYGAYYVGRPSFLD